MSLTGECYFLVPGFFKPFFVLIFLLFRSLSTPTAKPKPMSKKRSTSSIHYNSDDGVLLSGFEEDSDVKRYAHR
jgi:hypothetical protein